MSLSTLSSTNVGADTVSTLGQVSTKIGQTAHTAGRRDISEISSFSVLAGSLQDLHQSSPADYRIATSRIANSLQTAAANGAGADANQTGVLNNLAAQFHSASSTGELPNWPELANAVAGPGRVSATPLAAYQQAEQTSTSGFASLVLGTITSAL